MARPKGRPGARKKPRGRSWELERRAGWRARAFGGKDRARQRQLNTRRGVSVKKNGRRVAPTPAHSGARLGAPGRNNLQIVVQVAELGAHDDGERRAENERDRRECGKIGGED